MSYYCSLVYRIDKKVRTIQVDIFKQSYTWLKGLCEIVQFLLNTVIVVTSFVWFQHCVFVIATVMGDCTILILRTLKFGPNSAGLSLLIVGGEEAPFLVVNCLRKCGPFGLKSFVCLLQSETPQGCEGLHAPASQRSRRTDPCGGHLVMSSPRNLGQRCRNNDNQNRENQIKKNRMQNLNLQ